MYQRQAKIGWWGGGGRKIRKQYFKSKRKKYYIKQYYNYLSKMIKFSSCNNLFFFLKDCL